jgi:hypothetical protein
MIPEENRSIVLKVAGLPRRAEDVGTLQRTPGEVADIIEQFLDGTGAASMFENFCSMPIGDPELEAIRRRCSQLHTENCRPHQYSRPANRDMMRTFVKALRRTARKKDAEQ